MLFLTSLAYYITSTFYMKSSGSHSYYTFVIFPSLHLHLRHSYTDVNTMQADRPRPSPGSIFSISHTLAAARPAGTRGTRARDKHCQIHV